MFDPRSIGRLFSPARSAAPDPAPYARQALSAFAETRLIVYIFCAALILDLLLR